MGKGVYTMCVCFRGDIHWDLFPAHPLLILSHFLFVLFSLPTISPSEPGAPCNRPLPCWLDFSLVNSPRLPVTSSGSLPTDYTLSFFLLLQLHQLLEERMARHWCDVSCLIQKAVFPERLGLPGWRACKLLNILLNIIRTHNYQPNSIPC